MKRNCVSFLKSKTNNSVKRLYTNPAAVSESHKSTTGVQANAIQTNYGDCLMSLKFNVGTRDEDYDHAGATHFIKRFFYGPTNLRTQLAFIYEMEALGCSVRVEHGREELVYIVQGPNEETVSPAFDRFFEHVMMGRYIDWDLPPKKQAVAYDIKESLDVPEIIVSDAIHEAAFGKTGLGNNLVAPAHSLNTVTVDTLLDFMDKYFNTNNMSVNHVGLYFQEDELKEMGENIPTTYLEGEANNRSQSKYVGGYKHIAEHRFGEGVPQTYAALAFKGESIANNATTVVLSNILGSGTNVYTGSLKSSGRLQAITEQDDSLISSQSFVNSYSDDGLFGVYYTAQNGKGIETAMKKTVDQLQEIASGKITAEEVKKGANQSMRQFYTDINTTNGAHQLLLDGYDREMRAQSFQKVTPEALKRTAQQLLKSNPSIAGYGNVGGVPFEL